MKKIVLFFIAALCSVQFVNAQEKSFSESGQDSAISANASNVREIDYGRFFDPADTYKDSIRWADLRRGLLSNEEFFEKADLIIECKRGEFLGYYDAKGEYNPDDFYTVFEVLVLRVFKGDTALAGKTISYMKKGGVIYKSSEEAFSEGIRFYDTSLGMDHGVSISDTYSSIQFLVKSDYPENPDKSKNYPQPKFKPLQNKEKARIISWGDGRMGGLNDLVFNNRGELYHYMSQYKGIVVPETMLTPITPKVDFDDFDSATREIIQKKWGNPEKKSPDGSNNSNTLTLTIANQETTYAGGKEYLEFDLLASTNNPNIYFDGAPFKIEYNAAAFGANIVSGNKLSVTIDNAFNKLYALSMFRHKRRSKCDSGDFRRKNRQSGPASAKCRSQKDAAC